ncbi:MAG TPA: cytochrome C [Burkholderiaceae bacterium]|nr:cytochrome C [Burkholderiaceae bacterium]
MMINIPQKIPIATAFGTVVLFVAACGGSNQDQANSGLDSGIKVQADQVLSSGTQLQMRHDNHDVSQKQGDDGKEQSDKVLPVAPNASGQAATFSTQGFIDKTNPFFKAFGNGRTCASCHQENEGWSISPRQLLARFNQTAGTDPIFALVDGANSPLADVSTLAARRTAYSMLLNKGLIRIGIGIPADAEFVLEKVDDPYGFASAKELSLFRRPLPSTNLKFLSTVMWDARETFKDPNSLLCILNTTNCFASLDLNLAHQSNGAVRGHEQAADDLTPDEQRSIVQFEMSLFTAQVYDDEAKNLTLSGARGGPRTLSMADFYFGINDVLSGDYKTHASFDANAMTLYPAWLSATEKDQEEGYDNPKIARARQAIARGEALFNTAPINIAGVSGINDELKIPVLKGTCTTCHNTPSAGSHSTPLPLNIGLSDASRRTPDQPLYTLRNILTGETVETTDPGRALLTGKWQDIGRFKGPVLRGLAARPPYFHNGSAKDLEEVVNFYNTRFDIHFTPQEISDLVAFLKAL